MENCCLVIRFSTVDSGTPSALVFRGYIDCSTNPNYPAAISGDLYIVSVAGRIGGAGGAIVEVGDQITCITDNAGGTQAAVGIDWSIAQANITYAPENAANKDASNGYVGLTLFKINFLNALGSFISFFANSNTAARTYTFQDKNGTIADTADVAASVTTQTIGSLIAGANNKATPIDADTLALSDSATGNILTKLTWANLKAVLKTYFDTLYATISQTFFLGTTSIAINRASAAIILTGITSIDGNAATVTTNANLTGDVTSSGNVTTIGSGKVTEGMQILIDNTTQDVSTSKHGYAPKAPNDITKYLDGTGAYSIPASSRPLGYNNVVLSFSGSTLSYKGESTVNSVGIKLATSTIGITPGSGAGWRYVVADSSSVITIETIPGGEITADTIVYSPAPTFNNALYGFYSSVNPTKRIIGVLYFDDTNILKTISYGIGTRKNDDFWLNQNFGIGASSNNQRLQLTGAWTYSQGTNITCVDNGSGTSDSNGLRITANNSGFINIGFGIQGSGFTTLVMNINKNGSAYLSDFMDYSTGIGVITSFTQFFNFRIPVQAGDYFVLNTSSIVTGSAGYNQMQLSFEEFV